MVGRLRDSDIVPPKQLTAGEKNVNQALYPDFFLPSNKDTAIILKQLEAMHQTMELILTQMQKKNLLQRIWGRLIG